MDIENICVVIITNQSGIERGYFDWNSYQEVTKRMLKMLGYPKSIGAIYANGYLKNQFDNISCWRKPSPGMLLKASEHLNLDLRNSAVIGDRCSDLDAGANADLRLLCHVLTGKGFQERDKVSEKYNSTIGKSPITSSGNKSLLLANNIGDLYEPIVNKIRLSHHD